MVERTAHIASTWTVFQGCPGAPKNGAISSDGIVFVLYNILVAAKYVPSKTLYFAVTDQQERRERDRAFRLGMVSAGTADVIVDVRPCPNPQLVLHTIPANVVVVPLDQENATGYAGRWGRGKAGIIVDEIEVAAAENVDGFSFNFDDFVLPSLTDFYSKAGLGIVVQCGRRLVGERRRGSWVGVENHFYVCVENVQFVHIDYPFVTYIQIW
jgi:hypothetical protein